MERLNIKNLISEKMKSKPTYGRLKPTSSFRNANFMNLHLEDADVEDIPPKVKSPSVNKEPPENKAYQSIGSHYKLEVLSPLDQSINGAQDAFPAQRNGGFNQLAVDFLAGFATFFIVGVMCISMATTIFSIESLQPHLGSGINMAALGVFVSGVALILLSKVPFMIGSPDLFLCPFFSVMANAMLQINDQESQRATFFATLIVATTLTGLCLVLSGEFKLLRFSEFIPYPVVCGLLAGIGVLLIEMGIKLALPVLTLDCVLGFLPGLVYGIIDSFFKLQGLTPTKGLLPLTMVSILLFYAVVFFLGLDRTYLEGNNFLFSSSVVADAHFTALWPSITEFSLIDWNAVLSCSETILVMIILVVLKASLMWPGCEKLFEVELNHAGELSSLGWANLIGGACGSFGATPILSTMVMVQQMGGTVLRPVCIHLAFMAIFYFMSFEIVAYIPKFIFVGLLLSQGYALVHSWMILPFQRIPRVEWLIIIIINGFFLLIGMLPAVAIGAGFSVVLFAYHFYAVGCLKGDGTGLTIRSGIDRTQEEQQWLDSNGDCIRVLELQGYMFFGNASQLFAHVRSIFQENGDTDLSIPRFLVLDLPLMLGVDASAVDAFIRITKLAKDNRCRVFIAGANKTVKRYLRKKGSLLTDSRYVRFFWDMDEALGVCEDTVLRDVVDRIEQEWVALEGKSVQERFKYTLEKASKTFNYDTSSLEKLCPFVTAFDLNPGDILFNQTHGTKINYKKEGLYFIEHGFITVQRDPQQSITVKSKIEFLKKERNLARIQARNFRLTRLGAGYCIGSLELCSGHRSLGTYRADTICRVYFLPFQKVLELEESDPVTVLNLYKLLSRIISHGYDRTKEKLANVTDTMYGAPVLCPNRGRTLSGGQ